MLISRLLKEKNIAEYLLYMWQVEDLIRANDLDIDKIRSTIVPQSGLADDERRQIIQWYEELIAMMRSEGVVERGHLQINKNVIIALTDLHNRLLGITKYPYYTAAYYRALPFIVELRAKGDKQEEPELETCFEALYGVMLLRLQKKPVSEGTTKALEAIASFLSMLANYYDKDRKEELEFD